MHAVALGAVVLEENLDGVADFGVEGGAEHTEVFPLGGARFELGERGVGVFAIDGLAIDVSDLVLVGFEIHFGIFVGGHAHHVVFTHGGVVPVDFIDGDKVGASFALGAGLSGGE